MSVSQTVTEDEVYLVNIMSIAEDRLQSNFKTILKKLQEHDRMFQEQEIKLNTFKDQQMLENRQRDREFRDKFEELEYELKQVLEDKIDTITQNMSTFETQIKENSQKLKKDQSDKIDIRLQISELRDLMRNQLQQISKSVKKVQSQIYKAFQEIYKKQDSTEALKLSKQLDMIKQKSYKFENDNKLLEHKLEKIQILGERAEKNQIKKETELLKDIEERIKKEIKLLQRGLTNVTAEINSREDILKEDLNMSIARSINYRPVLKQRVSLQPQTIQEDDSILHSKNSFERMAINKLNQKFSHMQTKLKQFQDKFKDMDNTKKSRKKVEQDKFKDKLDEIKPELVKLWAKCDALDDRIVFYERRSEERNKTLNGIIQSQKENNWAKMEEKLNVFQTQMYATLKQVKAKVDSKLNNGQFEKYCHTLEDRIKQITELIYLKSDKLQVKKALLFLQSKIKQIILVISEDEQQEKDALLTKKQLKCISCDKDIDKMSNKISTSRGNWDGLPFKDHSPELLGRFGMTNFGSLSKKLKKLDSKDLPVLKKKSRNCEGEKQNA